MTRDEVSGFHTPLLTSDDRRRVAAMVLVLLAACLALAIAFIWFRLSVYPPALFASGLPVVAARRPRIKARQRRTHDCEAAAGGETIDLLDGYMFEHERRARRS